MAIAVLLIGFAFATVLGATSAGFALVVGTVVDFLTAAEPDVEEVSSFSVITLLKVGAAAAFFAAAVSFFEPAVFIAGALAGALAGSFAFVLADVLLAAALVAAILVGAFSAAVFGAALAAAGTGALAAAFAGTFAGALVAALAGVLVATVLVFAAVLAGAFVATFADALVAAFAGVFGASALGGPAFAEDFAGALAEDFVVDTALLAAVVVFEAAAFTVLEAPDFVAAVLEVTALAVEDLAVDFAVDGVAAVFLVAAAFGIR